MSCTCATKTKFKQLSGADATTIVQLRVKQLDKPHPTDAPRFYAWLAAARRAGYTLECLGQAIGVTREYIRQLVERATDDVPDVPPVAGGIRPPVDLPWPTRKDPWRRWPRPTLAHSEIAELREMQYLAEQLRGGHAATDPRRIASEGLAARLADLRALGFRNDELDALLELRPGTARTRLQRHGYSRLAPSQNAYRGAPDRKPEPRKRARPDQDITRTQLLADRIGTEARPRRGRLPGAAQDWQRLSPTQQALLRHLHEHHLWQQGRGPYPNRFSTGHYIVTARALERRGLARHHHYKGPVLTDRGLAAVQWATEQAEGD